MKSLFLGFNFQLEVQGYKNHACIDNKHKLIREYEATSAEVHDS